MRYVTPELRIFSGVSSLSRLSAELARKGCTRPVLFCGASLARSEVAIKKMEQALGASCAGVFDEVQSNSPLAVVERGVEFLLSRKADSIVALGGGSAIVTARAANVLAHETQSAHKLASYRNAQGKFISPKLVTPKVPLFNVPTTPTTAIVKAGSGVQAGENGDRLTFFDPMTRATSIFIDDDLIGLTPDDLVLSSALNALTMAVEGLENPVSSHYSDALLIHALRLLYFGLLNSPGQRFDVETRRQFIAAAILCGQGTDFSSPGLASALGHSLGIVMGIPNGVADAIVLPKTMRFNLSCTRPNYDKISAAIAEPGKAMSPEEIISRLEHVFASANIQPMLSAYGFSRTQIPDVIKRLRDDWFFYQNPRPVTNMDDVSRLLDNLC